MAVFTVSTYTFPIFMGKIININKDKDKCQYISTQYTPTKNHMYK
jgi:hypothetical protein